MVIKPAATIARDFQSVYLAIAMGGKEKSCTSGDPLLPYLKLPFLVQLCEGQTIEEATHHFNYC